MGYQSLHDPSSQLIGLYTLFAQFFLLFIRLYSFLFLFSSLRNFLRQSGIVILASALAFSRCDLIILGAGSIDQTRIEAGSLCLLCFREMLIGFITGLPLALVVESFPMFGRVSDSVRGAQFAEQHAPLSGERVSPLENLSYMAVPIFGFCLGGYELVLKDILVQAKSMVLPVAGFNLDIQTILNSTLEQSSAAIKIGVSAAAPVIILCFIYDLLTALLSRSLPRVNISFELLPFKLVLGLILFALCSYSFQLV